MEPLFLVTLTLLALGGPGARQGAADTPPELGRVRFGRDVDQALELAGRTGKPVFLLFQEIPGCSTCKSFGAGPLSHPLLVEAIETLFVPVVVHNNQGGHDAAALERFGEPAWNNPVVRYLDASGRDLLPRAEGLWSSAAVSSRLVAALERARQPVPRWLALAAAELEGGSERVVFTMHCFWEGQAVLGGLEGVVDAQPGFLEGAEVVDVSFAPGTLALADLVRAADRRDCAVRVSGPTAGSVAAARALVGERARPLAGAVRPAPASDDLRHLQAVRALDLVPLARTQALRVNAALAAGTDPAGLLSPRQLAWRSALERALAKDGAALDALARPAEAARLPAYCDELTLRLAVLQGGG